MVWNGDGYAQFGFDGGDEWIWRRNELFSVLHSNPKAKFVTRVVQFGSEPLFDQAIDPYELAKEVDGAKENLAPLGIPVTVSDLAFSYQRVSRFFFCHATIRNNRGSHGLMVQKRCWTTSTSWTRTCYRSSLRKRRSVCRLCVS
jgi:hypothetical protein